MFGLNLIALKAKLLTVIGTIGLLIGAFFSIKKMGKKEFKAEVSENNYKDLIQDVKRTEEVKDAQEKEDENIRSADDGHDYLVKRLSERNEIQ